MLRGLVSEPPLLLTVTAAVELTLTDPPDAVAVIPVVLLPVVEFKY
jgi:hypothetical protein